MPWEHCGNEGLLDDALCPDCGSDRGILNLVRGGTFAIKVTRPRTLKLRLLDRQGNPIAGEPFSLQLPDGTTSKGELNDEGQVRLPSGAGDAVIVWPNRLPEDFVPPPEEEGEPPPGQDPAEEAEETDEGGARFTRRVGRRHTFCVKQRLRLKVSDEKQGALSDARYVLVLGEADGDTEQREGRTDGDGLIDEQLPDGVVAATLTVFRPKGPELHLKLQLGRLQGLGTTTGTQARLNALGYDCGKVDDDHGPKLSNAIAAFQKTCELPPTGRLDDETKAKLRDAYGL